MLRALLASVGIHAGLVLALLMLLGGIQPVSVQPTVEVDLVVAHNPRGQVMDSSHDSRPRMDPAPEDRPARRIRSTRGVPSVKPRPVASRRPAPRVPRKAKPRRRQRRASRPPDPRPTGGEHSAKQPRQPGPPQDLPTTDQPDQHGCLLSMRGGCGATSPGKTPPANARPADRFASFRPRHVVSKGAAPPRVVGRSGYRGLEVARYEDGGRLIKATGKRNRSPGRGELGLLTLSSHKIGGRAARKACNPYRGRAQKGDRTLVLLVDTSGSVVDSGRAPDSILCAAGAALGALSRGYAVAVANFSSSVWYLRRTRSEDDIYKVLSRFQGEETRLPPAALLRKTSDHKGPRDFVLVSDAAIQNLSKVLPGYTRLIREDRRNRALRFVLGDGVGCIQCAEGKLRGDVCTKCEVTTTDHVRRMEGAGFVADRVQKPDDDLFRAFVLDTLFRGSPGNLLWGRR